MGVKQVNLNEYTCDNPACGTVLLGELGDGETYGIMGHAFEHNDGGGGAGFEWFACKRDCIPGAVKWALEEGWRPNDQQGKQL